MSCVTTLFAPITQCFPISTVPAITTFVPIHVSSPIDTPPIKTGRWFHKISLVFDWLFNIPILVIIICNKNMRTRKYIFPDDYFSLRSHSGKHSNFCAFTNLQMPAFMA